MDSFRSYINTLPEPLEKEEQNKLLKEFYATRSAGIRDKLIVHNLRLVARLAVKYGRNENEREEFMQIGTVELMHVLDNKFDISRGVAFSTYAYVSIKDKLLNELNISRRSADVLNKHCLYVDPVNKDEEELDIFDIIGENDDWVNDIAERDRIERFLKTLDNDDRYILEHRLDCFGTKLETFEVIAEKLGQKVPAIKSRLYFLYKELREYYLNGCQIVQDAELGVVLNYLQTTQNEQHKIILEHAYGLNGKEKKTQKDIAKEVGLHPQTVGKIIDRIIQNDEEKQEEVTIEDIKKYLSTSRNQKEILVAEYFFGINGKKEKSLKSIAEEFDLHYVSILAIIPRMKKKILKQKARARYTEGLDILDLSHVQVFYDQIDNDVDKRLLEFRYGLNGAEKVSGVRMAEILNMTYSAVSRRLCRLDQRIKQFTIDNEMSK